MPVDKMIVDAMLGTFRSMLQECRDKNLSGDDMNALAATLARMEQLAVEMDDTGAYSGQLVQEGLFMKFSDHYSKVLSAAAQQTGPANSDLYDEAADTQLLQNTLHAYRDAVKRIKENKTQVKEMMGNHAADADVLFKDKIIIDAIEQLVALGESGISYPRFLSQIIEKGLDKALEGSVVTGESLRYLLDAAKATAANPFLIKKEEEKLALHTKLAAASFVHVADSLQFQLGCEKIEWTYEPDIIKWNKVKQGWEKSLFWLDEWITSYCSFAPFIEPWAAAKDPKEAVKESQDCVPGKLRVWEKINHRYFGLSLKELFSHPSFAWDVEQHWMYWSQEYAEFLVNEVLPVCMPFQQPAVNLIAVAEKMHTDNRKINPNIHQPSLRYARFFNSYFGEGEFVKRYGETKKVDSNAAAWTAANF
jgi:hypothetical protein